MGTCNFCGSTYGSGYSCKHYVNCTPTIKHPFVSNPNMIDATFNKHLKNKSLNLINQGIINSI